MTPAQFIASYLDTARQVSAGTGIFPAVLLAQWANETAWGSVVVGNNLGNIRCSPTSFCRYPSRDLFVQACISTWHNGYYGAVLAAKTPIDQLNAICASPWDAGHYGGSLVGFYFPIYSLLGGDMIFVLRHTSNGAEYLVDAAGKRAITPAVATALDSAAKAGGQNGLIVIDADAALDQIPDALSAADRDLILQAIAKITTSSSGPVPTKITGSITGTLS